MLTGLLRLRPQLLVIDAKLLRDPKTRGARLEPTNVVPRKGHDHRCAYAGKSIRGQMIEDQADLHILGLHPARRLDRLGHRELRQQIRLG